MLRLAAGCHGGFACDWDHGLLADTRGSGPFLGGPICEFPKIGDPI